MIAQFDYHHTVTKEDIDELGHAGNFHYIRWMQHAAIAHSGANGWTAGDYRELGSGWVVRSHKITYLKPAFEGEALVIRTWVANMKPATSLRLYEIRNGAGEVLARAETDWAFISYQSLRPTRIPPKVANSFPIVD